MNANLAIQAIEAMEPYARRFMEQYERETPGWQKEWFLSWQQANLILTAYDTDSDQVLLPEPTIFKFHYYPTKGYACSQPGDNTGYYVNLNEYERLRSKGACD